MHEPDATTPLATRLTQYFEENGFGPDGGYEATWVDFSLGPIPFPFPNTPARKRAVRYHDLHHLVTGYRTDLPGEFEISAWEIGAGCKGFLAAWQLNLGGMAGGLFLCPRRSFRAFVRGRHSDTLYGRAYDDALLGLTVGEARRLTRLDTADAARPSALDVALFVVASLFGLAVGLVFFALALPLAVIAYPILRLAARRSRASSAPPSSRIIHESA
jgi:hypothetical protein